MKLLNILLIRRTHGYLEFLQDDIQAAENRVGRNINFCCLATCIQVLLKRWIDRRQNV